MTRATVVPRLAQRPRRNSAAPKAGLALIPMHAKPPALATQPLHVSQTGQPMDGATTQTTSKPVAGTAEIAAHPHAT